MEAVSVSRAVMSGGLWFGVAYALTTATGANVSMMDLVADSGMMAVSAVGADLAHGMLGWVPTGTTSAVLTGAYYAGLQKLVRGDNNYLMNGVVAGANDFLVEKATQAQRASQNQAMMAQSYEEEE